MVLQFALMPLITRPYWLSLATTTDLAVCGVCVEPWQVKPLFELFQAHHESLEKKEALVSGWSFRHVREPVMTAWKLCEKLGLPSSSEVFQMANIIDRGVKDEDYPQAWQWTHVQRDRRTTCATPFSTCLLARAQDSSLIADFAKTLIVSVGAPQSDMTLFGGALMLLEQDVDFLDPVSALERIRERIKSSARRNLDFTRFDELRAWVDQWILDQGTPSAPAVCNPVRL